MSLEVAFEVVRLALAALFAVAGIAKLFDLPGATQAVRGFGFPRRLARPIAFSMSCVEIAIAGGLLVTVSARLAAAAAATLLLVFAVAVAATRLRGRTPECHCFGRLHSAPAGWGVVSRNLVLAALAGALAARLMEPIGSAAFIACALIAEPFILVVLLRRYGRALARIDELEARRSKGPPLVAGDEALAFSLVKDDGAVVEFRNLLRRGRDVLLVFVDPECGPCHALMPDVARWSQRLAGRLTIVVLATRPDDANDVFAGHADSFELVVQEDREMADLYGVEATPSAILVGTDGRIVRGPVAGAAAIGELVRTIESSSGDDTSQERRLPSSAPRLAAATSLAAATAVVAVSEKASARVTQDPALSERQSIHATLRAAGPRLVAASRRSSEATVALATLRPGRTLRRKQAMAAQALDLERKELLRLSSALNALRLTTQDAYNARASALVGLSRLALSLQKRKQALGAAPDAVSRLLTESDLLYRKGLDSIAASAQILGRG